MQYELDVCAIRKDCAMQLSEHRAKKKSGLVPNLNKPEGMT